MTPNTLSCLSYADAPRVVQLQERVRTLRQALSVVSRDMPELRAEVERAEFELHWHQAEQQRDRGPRPPKATRVVPPDATLQAMESTMARAVRSTMRVDDMAAWGAHAQDSGDAVMDGEHLLDPVPGLLQQAIRGDADPAAVLDRRRRAELAWQQRVKSWLPGSSVRPLLQLPPGTVHEQAILRSCVEHILGGPMLQRLVRRQYTDGAVGAALAVAAPDGTVIPATECSHLLQGMQLLETLRAHTEQVLQMSQSATIDPMLAAPLCMAQRLAAVVIHHAVRDAALYGLQAWRQCVVDVLRLPRGLTCANARAVVALARAAGVPAGSMVTWMDQQPDLPGVGVQTRMGAPLQPLYEAVGWVLVTRTPGGQWAWRTVHADPAEVQADNLATLRHTCSRRRDFDGATGCTLELPRGAVYGVSGPHTACDGGAPAPLPDGISLEMRRNFLKLVHLYGARGVPLSNLAQCFATVLEREKIAPLERFAARFSSLERGYRRCIEQALQTPGVLAAWPDRVSVELAALLQSPPMVHRLAQHPVVDDALVQAMWHGLSKRLQRLLGPGVDVDRVLDGPPLPAVRCVVDAAVAFMAALEPTGLSELAEGFAKSRQYATFCLYGQQSTQRIGQLARMLESTHRFMTECYPATATTAWGALPARWLARDKQHAYLQWMSHYGTASLFRDATAGVLAYVRACKSGPAVPDDRCGVADPLGTAYRLGLVDDSFHDLVAFHQHLLGNVQTEVFAAYRGFLRHAGGAADADAEVSHFATWMAQHRATLMPQYRRDVLHNPAYVWATAEFLLRRLSVVVPAPARQILADFVALMETRCAAAPPGTWDETALDAAFERFTRERGAAYPAVRQACGAVFDLWKAQQVAPHQRTSILARLYAHACVARPGPVRKTRLTKKIGDVSRLRLA